MKRLLNFMQTGSHVYIKTLSGKDEAVALPGFEIEKYDDEYCLCAQNASRLNIPGTILCYGNPAQALLFYNGKEVDKLMLRDVFPKQTTVIVLSRDKHELLCFAPICQNKKDLVRFIADMYKFCDCYDNIYAHVRRGIDLALWLYKHNPFKKKEPEWGI